MSMYGNNTVLKTPQGDKKGYFKILFLGSYGAGKTSIIHRYNSNEFLEHPYPLGYISKDICLQSMGVTLVCKIFNDEEKDKFIPDQPGYYEELDAAVVIIDPTNEKSETEAILCITELQKRNCTPKVLAIGFNKADIEKNIEKLASDFKALWGSSLSIISIMSAKTGAGINEFFTEIATKIFNSELDERKVNDTIVNALIMGSKGVGKSSIIERLSINMFMGGASITENPIPPEVKVGPDCYKTLNLTECDNIYDLKKYKKQFNIFIIVYDINNEATKISIKDWMKKIRKIFKYEIMILILGNKCDLLTTPLLNIKEILSYQSDEVLHKIVSAKNGFGVTNAFEDFLRKTIMKKIPFRLDSNNTCCIF